jgi:hypothetical protein
VNHSPCQRVCSFRFAACRAHKTKRPNECDRHRGTANERAALHNTTGSAAPPPSIRETVRCTRPRGHPPSAIRHAPSNQSTNKQANGTPKQNRSGKLSGGMAIQPFNPTDRQAVSPTNEPLAQSLALRRSAQVGTAALKPPFDFAVGEGASDRARARNGRKRQTTKTCAREAVPPARRPHN